MNIAILARLGAQSLLLNLARLWNQQDVVAGVVHRPCTPVAQVPPEHRPQQVLPAVAAPAQQSRSDAHRPLRIVRVVESGQRTNSVGRMVISGRMADVCAELERLAAREAALT
jgi:hypothetical protein